MKTEYICKSLDRSVSACPFVHVKKDLGIAIQR